MVDLGLAFYQLALGCFPKAFPRSLPLINSQCSLYFCSTSWDDGYFFYILAGPLACIFLGYQTVGIGFSYLLPFFFPTAFCVETCCKGRIVLGPWIGWGSYSILVPLPDTPPLYLNGMLMVDVDEIVAVT